ncbi:uncharacterized protein ARMOST_10949 [Armillaria ostoyae]|uniref:Uncharacterized protein n=1 Tax=Armillaria ostoyae TaxID=47428 RepID=A0A284RFR3_ARMOS|nr:uncharacterized protein ARMOST_10949 [Armillaria ostoyae]
MGREHQDPLVAIEELGLVDDVDRVDVRKACSVKTIFLHCTPLTGQTPMEVDLRYVRDLQLHEKPESIGDMQSLEIDCTLCEDPCGSDIHLVEFLRTTPGIRQLKLSVAGITEYPLCSLAYQSLLPSLEHLYLTGSTFAFQDYQVMFVRTVRLRRNPVRIQTLGPVSRQQHLDLCSDWASSICAHSEVGTTWKKLLDEGLEVCQW